jgi:hypothetical protein
VPWDPEWLKSTHIAYQATRGEAISAISSLLTTDILDDGQRRIIEP